MTCIEIGVALPKLLFVRRSAESKRHVDTEKNCKKYVYEHNDCFKSFEFTIGAFLACRTIIQISSVPDQWC